MPNTPQTAFARLRALILSTDPLPMTPRMQQQLLGALASPLTRRLAKLAGFGTIASVVLCLTLIVPFTTMVLELSERDVLASLSALSGPMMLICTASVFTYGLSSSLWHAGFHRHAHVADAPEDADAAAETPPGGDEPGSYRVTRNGCAGAKTVSYAAVIDFVTACGIRDELEIEAVLAGVPVDVDGGTVIFERISR